MRSAGDQGSIPCRGEVLFLFFYSLWLVCAIKLPLQRMNKKNKYSLPEMQVSKVPLGHVTCPFFRDITPSNSAQSKIHNGHDKASDRPRIFR